MEGWAGSAPLPDAVPPLYGSNRKEGVVYRGRHSWKGFSLPKITWDEELIQKLVSVEGAFWNQHILTGRMPALDGSKACDELLGQYFGRARKKSSIPLIGFDEKLERREELLQMKETLEQEQRQIEQEIKLVMQENEKAFTKNYQITWSNVEIKKCG